jgi:hypothetical protein
MRFRPVLYLLTGVLLMLPPPLYSQEEVSKEVIAGGGATVSNGEFILSHTLGQTSTGTVSGGDHIEQSGFWYTYTTVLTYVYEEVTPAAFRLYQNYPNPFNPVTNIRFSLPRESRVTLRIYDAAGREVMTVLDGDMAEGLHEIPVRADGMASGVYFYRLTSGRDIDTKKMVILR